ncbi:alanine racemase [Salipaludibacillus sp. LMS25]|uniref:alanine racemase n=1 Tax=Salipaludibacillus sp. LMS25 TaxID=2924031 RepID=UPI0020D0FDC8|nr:alanine racemase [Salipaludibacillus sp. LMS25]UTR13407.1 alanine racemase [Salipaludibacillus sp. LMS25]
MKEDQSFYRDTWVEVNLDAISENVKAIKGNLPEGVHVMAVVKANAYGHGAVEVATEALAAGATYLGVAILDEALALRQAGIKAPILVLGLVRPADCQLAADNDIALTVFQKDWFQTAAAYLSGRTQLRCHIKMDTGMGRLGLRTVEEIDEIIPAIRQIPNLVVEGLFTHLATADEVDMPYFEKQQTRFSQLVKRFEKKYGAEIPLKHCANSAAALRFGDRSYNLVRLGIAMYGLSPSPAIKPLLPVPLHEAFTLQSNITHIKKLPKGEGVSYGVTYETTGAEWIATVPIGYADGWIRANQSGDVLVNGERAPIVGRICMDQMMILLQKPVKVGTTVTLIGNNNGEVLSMDEVAERLNTINYEIPCVISYRVPRVIKRNGKVVKVYNKTLSF